MAISVDWPTRVINIPKADTQLVQAAPTEIRQLDLDAFRLTLKDLEDGEDGIAHPDTHSHNQPVTVGGVTLARVVEIINGYTVTFEDGQYAVNLVGANSNVGDVVNVNQVSIRSANSAGLTFSEEINNQSFTNNLVYIDTAGGLPGTEFPRGTPTDKVNNYDDANTIADARSYRGFHLDGTIIFNGTENLAAHGGHSFYADSPIRGALVLQGNSVTGAVFTLLGITGAMSGRPSFRECSFSDMIGFQGIAKDCGFSGTVVCDATSTEAIVLINCISVVAGTARPVLDLNGCVSAIHVRGYTGGLTISNFSGASNMSLDFCAGTVELDATCTSGVAVVRGDCALIDNSGPGCTVVDLRPNRILLDTVLP